MSVPASAKWIFLFFACLYMLSIGRGFYSSDGEVMFKTTAALVERHTFALDPDPGLPQIVPGRDNRYYSKYNPGFPLLAIPLYEVGDRLGAINNAHRYRLSATFVLLLPALAAALTICALAQIVRRVERGLGGEVMWLILASGLATPLWMYARVLFTESVLALCLTAAVGLIVPSSSETSLRSLRLGGSYFPFLTAGLIIGIGLLTRAAFAIYISALIWLIWRQSPPQNRLSRLIAFGTSIFPFAAGLLWHNTLRFGDPLQFGYGGESFTTLPWEGIAGLLISPGKGMFFYAPPLILSLILWPRFRRAYPALGEFLALAWITSLVFYGTWWAWAGGWSWGPRFLVPLIPSSCLPLIMLPQKHVWQGITAALILAGIIIQAAAVLTDLTPHYAAHPAPYYHQIPQVAAFRTVLNGQTEPLAMFHLSETGLPPTWSIGVPLVLLVLLLFSGTKLVKRVSQ